MIYIGYFFLNKKIIPTRRQTFWQLRWKFSTTTPITSVYIPKMGNTIKALVQNVVFPNFFSGYVDCSFVSPDKICRKTEKSTPRPKYKRASAKFSKKHSNSSLGHVECGVYNSAWNLKFSQNWWKLALQLQKKHYKHVLIENVPFPQNDPLSTRNAVLATVKKNVVRSQTKILVYVSNSTFCLYTWKAVLTALPNKVWSPKSFRSKMIKKSFFREICFFSKWSSVHVECGSDNSAGNRKFSVKSLKSFSTNLEKGEIEKTENCSKNIENALWRRKTQFWQKCRNKFVKIQSIFDS